VNIRNSVFSGTAGRHYAKFALLAAFCFSACAKEPQGDRKPVQPITGTVTVDGKPGKDIFVYLNPKTPDAAHPVRPYAQVDEEGKFTISTYEQGDGAPEGEYVVTLEWLNYNIVQNQWGGPDKLKNKYSDPQKSGITVRVEGKPVEMPAIELKID
jgi:hypothetical protein